MEKIEYATLLALRVEGGSMSQGLWASYRNGKKPEIDLLAGVSNPLAFLGHTLDRQTLMKTDEQKKRF